MVSLELKKPGLLSFLGTGCLPLGPGQIPRISFCQSLSLSPCPFSSWFGIFIYIFPTWYINLCTSDPPGTQLRIIMYLIQGLFNLPDILLGLLLGQPTHSRNIHQQPAKAGVHGSVHVGGWLVGFLLWQVVVGWVMKSEGIAELFPSFIYN